ncbi:MAG TPA: SufE family protein [Bacteroidales bacterium]|nr:SufE family protein [Bacteroidales bacterium]HQQ11696.1 SufE family protein [Bacteroidales bacterium]
MKTEEIQAQIISEFAAFDDWMDKYNLLIEMGKDTPMIDARFKTNNHLISGCQSKVWLHAEYVDGKVFFTADSDAVITKGIVNLLIRALSGQSPDDILATDLGFLDQIGLKEHLSPTRSNGLLSMVQQMKLYAKVFKLKAGN